jgi:apolipoprotein N-acyltransferase
MRKHLVVPFALLLIQTVLAFVAWPVPPLVEANPLSAGLVFLLPAPFYFFLLWYSGSAALVWGGLSGLAMFLPSIIFLTRIDAFPIVSWLIFLLLGVIIFFIFGSGCVLGNRLARAFPWAFPFLAPAVLTVCQFLRAQLSYYLWFVPPPVSMLAYPLLGLPFLPRIAAITGVYGAEFWVVFVASNLAWWLRQLGTAGFAAWGLPVVNTPAHVNKNSILSAGATFALLLILTYWGWNLSRVKSEQSVEKNSAVKVALVQPNFDIHAAGIWDRGLRKRSVQYYAELLSQAKQRQADLALFPEGALPGTLPEDTPMWEEFRDKIRAAGLATVAGLVAKAGPQKFMNQWFFVNPQGEIAGTYAKRFLVAFGEYLPWRPLLDPLERLFAWFAGRTYRFLKITATPPDQDDLSRGEGLQMFDLGGAKFFLSVCDEILFARLIREGVMSQSAFVLSPATGMWFKESWYAAHYRLITRYRAIEFGRWVGRTGNMADAYFVRPDGSVSGKLAFATPGVLVEEVPALSHFTPYAQGGDVFGWSLLLLTLAALGGSFLLRH